MQCPDTCLLQNWRECVINMDVRAAVFTVQTFYNTEVKTACNPRRDGFKYGFLDGKACGVKLGSVVPGFTLCLFSGGKCAAKERPVRTFPFHDLFYS